MADEMTMLSGIKGPSKAATFSEMAREEFAFTALAFFAPVVGTVNVMRGLLLSSPAPLPPGPDGSKAEAAPDAAQQAEPKGRKAA